MSIVGYAELRGSVARAARGGRIARDDYPTARLELERMWGTLAAIRLDGRLARLAGAWPTGMASGRSMRSTSRRRSASRARRARHLRHVRPAAARGRLAEGLTVLPEVA